MLDKCVLNAYLCRTIILKTNIMRHQIVVIVNQNTMQYFFSTNHCQEHGLGDDFIPVTHAIYTLPFGAGIPIDSITSIENLVNTFYSDMDRIENPDYNFTPEWI